MRTRIVAPLSSVRVSPGCHQAGHSPIIQVGGAKYTSVASPAAPLVMGGGWDQVTPALVVFTTNPGSGPPQG